jgi:hypothetical protein
MPVQASGVQAESWPELRERIRLEGTASTILSSLFPGESHSQSDYFPRHITFPNGESYRPFLPGYKVSGYEDLDVVVGEYRGRPVAWIFDRASGDQLFWTTLRGLRPDFTKKTHVDKLMRQLASRKLLQQAA